MKKFISALLAALMVFSVMPLTALAENGDDARYKIHETISVYGVIYDDGTGETFYFNDSEEPYEVIADEDSTKSAAMGFEVSLTAQEIHKNIGDWATEMGVSKTDRTEDCRIKTPPYPTFSRSTDTNPDNRYYDFQLTDIKFNELITRYDNAIIYFEGHRYTEPQDIEITELSATVSGIEAGATVGSTTASTEDETYTVEVCGWYDVESIYNVVYDQKLSDDAVLEGGRKYVVGVAFTPADGYAFATSLDVKINGEKAGLNNHTGNSRQFFVAVTVPEPEPEILTGWQYIDGNWYYYSAEGEMQTGWLYDGGKWYFLKSDGVMATGWVKSGNNWYFLSSSGAMATGWVKSGGKWYYMNSSGAMATGWVKSGSKWYFMSSSGAMVTGWVKSGGKWYYMDASGAMLANTSKKIGNKTYKFNASGVCTNP